MFKGLKEWLADEKTDAMIDQKKKTFSFRYGNIQLYLCLLKKGEKPDHWDVQYTVSGADLRAIIERLTEIIVTEKKSFIWAHIDRIRIC